MKRYNDNNSPNKEWKLGEYLGIPFENFVLNLIRSQLKKYHPNVQVNETPRVGDGGKDIIVLSDINQIEVLGQTFITKNNSLKIYFECKSTDDNILRYDKISSSISRVQYESIDYYVLVTNSTILPQAYWYIMEEFKNSQNNIKFVLIDSFILGTCLLNSGFIDKLNTPYNSNDTADFYYDFQIETLEELYNNYNIYIYFRNYSDKEKYCELQLNSDIDWSIAEDKISFIISPRETISKKISIKQEHFDGFDDLLFRLQVNGNESAIIINGIKGIQDFETPFFGETRKALLSNIISYVKSATPPKIICFWGDSGIGKTRMTKEIYYKLKGTTFDFFSIKIQRNNKHLELINNFLNEKGYVRKVNYHSLYKMISDCISIFNNHAIIIIDDLHFASEELLCELKEINNICVPVTLILCGRTDYSIGDINYMSFVHWSNMELPKYSYNIAPLNNTETKNFIRTIIDGIPQSALEKLFELSMNNPLFIVQYIEYLLDSKLVKLINRNTVGIIDINYFQSKKNIPKKISEIYKLRLSNLQSTNIGNRCIEILYILALCNGKINSEYLYKYIESDDIYLNELLKRRFIKHNSTNEISFIHESLFIYLYDNIRSKKTKLKELSNDLLRHRIDLQLDHFQLGRLCLYSNNRNSATKYFEPIILWLKETDNISNLNVKMEYYDYLNDIFDTLRCKKSTQELAKKALLIRIYTTLHHLIPINAVNECDDTLEKLKKYKLNDDEIYNLSIMELKAHALMNSALYQDGETLLKDIQVQWIINNNIINNETLFDLFDRLSSIYRHFNLKSLAIKYNDLSRNLALKCKDNKLVMLSNRTKYKIYLYTEPKLSFESIKETIALNQKVPLERIQMDNALDECGYNILTNKVKNIDAMIKDINNYLDIIDKKEFHRAKIHAYLLLATCSLLKNTHSSIIFAKKYTEMAIDLSTSYGIVKYLWRLNNIYGIIKMRLKYKEDDIYKTFYTVFDILKNRGLLFIGNCDLCHGNIFALSNIGYYLQEHKFETLFHELMEQITYSEKNRKSLSNSVLGNNPKNPYLVKQYGLAKDKKVLFAEKQPEYLIRDTETDYIIII